MLVVLNYNKLTFNNHVSKLCEKTSQKTHAFAWTSNSMIKEKLAIPMNTFSLLQFGCSPLV